MDYKYLFGPVPSRRLGVSLGIDLVPRKVCSFNCVYCESGATTQHTLERAEYVPLFRVLEELKDFLASGPPLDYITFSGSGEPTLHKGIGGVIKYLKQHYSDYPVALLTNSSLLNKPDVRHEIADCDLVVPSLDAVSKKVFGKLNRPAGGLNPMDVVNGLIRFREIYQGMLWLEIFIVPGLNDTGQELDLLSKAAERIQPDKVQLNFADRPGTEPWVNAPAREDIQRILHYFRRIDVEIISGGVSGTSSMFVSEKLEKRIVSLIARRPCTEEDIARSTGAAISQVNQLLDRLIDRKRIEFVTEERGVFFRLPQKTGFASSQN